MKKYGFVYIWFDRKHKRYYIGAHWGSIDDGYICSSTWMRNSYKRRPNDFRRKIISNNIDKNNLHLEENKWLSLIQKQELGKRYYNLVNSAFGTWDQRGVKRHSEETKAKMRNAAIGRKHSEETKQKLKSLNLGKQLSEETKAKISSNSNRIYTDEFREQIRIASKNRTPETRNKISTNAKRLVAEGKIGMSGRKHSEETKAKMKLAQLKRWSNDK